MNVMDGLKQAASTLRAADKIPEYNAILDAQQRIFDLQNENQELKQKLAAQNRIASLVFEDKHNWMIDPAEPSRRLCPTCAQKQNIKQPLRGNICTECEGQFT